MGIIFSNINEESIRALTERRTLGSVPFGARYRLIDFPLSNMVNSGINKVAVITKRNYQSLMDHLGSGKPWDLSRSRDGLYIFPPFGNDVGEFRNRVDMLCSIGGFIGNSIEEYVILSDCDTVCNIDYNEVINNHMAHQADITIIYKRGSIPEKSAEVMTFEFGEDRRINDIKISPNTRKKCNISMNMVIMKRELLLELIYGCISNNCTSFEKDALQSNVKKYRMFGYEFKGFNRVICSMGDYFGANMDLLNEQIRRKLFDNDRPIHTKIRDDMPCRYGLGCNAKNSLIGGGCVIEGQVENSIIFRGVKIGKGSCVDNCVIMQDTLIGENCNLGHIISDKDVTIKSGRTLMGSSSYPVHISKGSIV